MTEIDSQAGHPVWFEDLNSAVTEADVPGLAERLGIHTLAINDPSEWVIGYRILDATQQESATILYLTRRDRGTGVRFVVRTAVSEPPDTADLHALVKQYIRDAAQADEAHITAFGLSATPARWVEVGTAVFDYPAQREGLSRQDYALARAHVGERLDIAVPVLESSGMRGSAQVELSFPPTENAVAVVVGLGGDGPFSAVRVRARIGDIEITRRFSSHGIASIPSLDIDPRTDLLHLTFEVGT
jgi:hypothetical protein